MITARATSRLFAAPLLIGNLLMGSLLLAQNGLAAEAPVERWFQIEMTVFTHENSDLTQELWSPGKLSLGYPERLQGLSSLSEILQLDDWTALNPALTSALIPAEIVAGTVISPTIANTPPSGIDANAPMATANQMPETETPLLPLVGPLPFLPGESFRLPDFAREPFLVLPPDAHRLTATNRALNQAAQYRILFHNAWRQPMTRRTTAEAIGIIGGRQYNEHSELEGSVTFYFNNAGDRVVFNGNLWLSSFSTQDIRVDGLGSTENNVEEWTLPVVPGLLADANEGTGEQQATYFVHRIVQLREIREMREQELHYMDHPALGVLVQITPYTVPEPVVVPETAPAAAPASLTPAIP
ncbi:MAG: CsiV family protein [Pseudomonadota bacterium]